MIKIFELESTDQLKEIIPHLEFNPFRLIPGETPETKNAAWLCGLQKISQMEGSFIFLAKTNATISGLCAFTPLPWDSHLFQQKMGQIQYISVASTTKDPSFALKMMIEKVLEKAKSQKYSFLLHKCSSDNFQTMGILEKHGFNLKSTILNFSLNFQNQKISESEITKLPDKIHIRNAKPSDEEATVLVSHSAYDNFFGRYHADERFSRAQATHVYEEWIHSSFHGFADVILVAEHDKKIVGFSIWKKSSTEEKKLRQRISHLSLGAVDPEYASKGIYNFLLYEGLKVLQPDSDLITIPTQICNYPAQRAYIRLGWRPYDSIHDFHLWLND